MRGRQNVWAIRWPVALLARLEAFAAAHRMTLTTLVRLCVQRGLAAMEREAELAAAEPAPSPPSSPSPRPQVAPIAPRQPPASPPPTSPGRRIISRGLKT